jgi:hypothetical protein
MHGHVARQPGSSAPARENLFPAIPAPAQRSLASPKLDKALIPESRTTTDFQVQCIIISRSYGNSCLFFLLAHTANTGSQRRKDSSIYDIYMSQMTSQYRITGNSEKEAQRGEMGDDGMLSSVSSRRRWRRDPVHRHTTYTPTSGDT